MRLGRRQVRLAQGRIDRRRSRRGAVLAASISQTKERTQE